MHTGRLMPQANLLATTPNGLSEQSSLPGKGAVQVNMVGNRHQDQIVECLYVKYSWNFDTSSIQQIFIEGPLCVGLLTIWMNTKKTLSLFLWTLQSYPTGYFPKEAMEQAENAFAPKYRCRKTRLERKLDLFGDHT